MGKRLTPKQEAFARAYVETGNASEAYRLAYPKSRKWPPDSVHSRASHMLKNSKVLARVEALRAEHRARHDVTVDRLTEEAFEALETAKARGNVFGMVRALDFLARLHGLFVDRHEVKHTMRYVDVEVVAVEPDEAEVYVQ